MTVESAIMTGFGSDLLDEASEGSQRFQVPPVLVLAVGALCFVVFLAEGVILDWSAIYLREYTHLPISLTGLGFAAFSLSMVAGRLTGDRVVKKFGQLKTILFSCALSVLGFGCVIGLASPAAAILGFLLVGLGNANLAPCLISAAGQQANLPASASISVVTTIGYSGLIMGPALVGFLAHATSLAIAFSLIAISFLLVAIICLCLRRRIVWN
ncbi:MFS transporter [Pseudomonas putida]